MNLEEIQKELICNFDFDRALDILGKMNESYEKKDLIEIANNLIKLLYQSRENDDMIFSSGHLVASRSYIDAVEVQYTLNFNIDINSEFTYDLEKKLESVNEKEILKKELESLLERNKNEYEKNEDNDLALNNMYRLEKILIQFN